MHSPHLRHFVGPHDHENAILAVLPAHVTRIEIRVLQKIPDKFPQMIAFGRWK